MSFSKRILQKRVEMGMTQEELAKEIGVSRAAVNIWENPPSEYIFPRPKNLLKLCEVLEIDKDWLRFGDKQLEQKENASIIHMEPLLTSIEVKDWLFSKHYLFNKGVTMTTEEKESCCFRYTVEGDSMVGEFHNGKNIYSGDIVLIDPTSINNIKSGDIVMAQFGSLNDNYKARIYNKDGMDSYLSPLNVRYPQIQVDENVRIVGKVIRLYREF